MPSPRKYGRLFSFVEAARRQLLQELLCGILWKGSCKGDLRGLSPNSSEFQPRETSAVVFGGEISMDSKPKEQWKAGAS